MDVDFDCPLLLFVSSLFCGPSSLEEKLSREEPPRAIRQRPPEIMRRYLRAFRRLGLDSEDI